MQKTPDEIKKGLECCADIDANHDECPYNDMEYPDCFQTLYFDNIIYIKQLEAAQPKWISVEERLPEEFHPVLVYMPNEAPLPTVHEGYRRRNGRWWAAWYARELEGVTHWMPLPEPPEEDA